MTAEGACERERAAHGQRRVGARTFNVPSGEAELVPALEHAGLVVETVVTRRVSLLDADAEAAVGGGDLPWRGVSMG